MPSGPKRYTASEGALEHAEAFKLDLGTGTHGTAYTPGQTTVEGHQAAGTRATFPDYSKGDRAYYTATTNMAPEKAREHEMDTERSGWDWAGSAARSRGEPTLPDGGGIFGRPVVHDVEAHGEVRPDSNLDARSEMTADRLSITDTHWIRPPQGYFDEQGKPLPAPPGLFDNELGVQGTLPHLNWNQYAHPKMSGMDLNNAGISSKTRQMKGTREHERALEALGESGPGMRHRPALASDRERVQAQADEYDRDRRTRRTLAEQPRLPL
jgi:hypothetical protein